MARRPPPIRWLSVEAVRAMHRELIAEHGGLPGPAKPGLLEAALARPGSRLAYAEDPPSLAELAAACGFGLARAHAFPDGNKRIALAAIDAFLQLNGKELTASEADAVSTIRALAAGELSEKALAAWIDRHSEALAPE
jgi:death-on-curing protein